MPGALEGIRVVDLTSMISGPTATMILADQGADVIKVENPATGGDYVRHGANRRGGFSANFVNNNRNKRSVTLDLKQADGIAALLRIVATADVFIQNFRPGVAQRMGLGEDAVRAARPDIVYVSIAGFGFEGPYAPKPVYDPLIQALSGLATVQAGSDRERPRLVRTIVPDKVTALNAAQAVTAALLARERCGEGQHVHLAMLDAIVAFLWHSDMGSQTFVGDELPQQHAASFIDLIYETADGHISVAVMSAPMGKNRMSEANMRPPTAVTLPLVNVMTSASSAESVETRPGSLNRLFDPAPVAVMSYENVPSVKLRIGPAAPMGTPSKPSKYEPGSMLDRKSASLS